MRSACGPGVARAGLKADISLAPCFWAPFFSLKNMGIFEVRDAVIGSRFIIAT
jgi:hypothetical protein